MGGRSNKKINYDAYCIVSKNQSCVYSDRLECISSYNQMSMNTVKNPASEAAISFDDVAVPVRIMLDPTGKDMADDWTISSCVPELDYAAIMRWWPKKWLVKSDGTLIDKITVQYGPIDLNLTVVDVDPSVMEDSFSDVILPQDDVVDAVIMQENDMWKKKKIKVELPKEDSDMAVKSKTFAEEQKEKIAESVNESVQNIEDVQDPTPEVVASIEEVEPRSVMIESDGLNTEKDDELDRSTYAPCHANSNKTDKKSAKEFWVEHKKLGKRLKWAGIISGVACIGFTVFRIINIVNAANGKAGSESDSVTE